MKKRTVSYRALRTLHIIILLSLITMGSGAAPHLALHASPATGATDTDASLAVTSVETIAIDNTMDTQQFGGGVFRRTALSTKQLPASSPSIPDQPGAIQLMPVGALTDFEVVNGRLPVKIADMGVVTMGKYMIIIGGNKRIDNENVAPNTVETNEVWVGAIDQNTGMPPLKSQWTAAPSLPAVQIIDIPGLIGGNVAELSYPAVVGIPDEPGGDDGYIYVIGGFAKQAGFDGKTSSAAVHVGRFENGSLSWLPNASPLLPNPDTYAQEIIKSYGVHGAEALSVKRGDKTYIYVLGGLQSYYIPDTKSIEVNGSPYIFYAEMGSDGKPKHPETGDPGWAVMRVKDSEAPITIPPEKGLWFSSSVAYVGTDERGKELDPAIFLFGGQQRIDRSGSADQYSKTIHRGIVQEDGRIAWNQNWDPETHKLPQNPLAGMVATEFGGNIYLPGGNTYIFNKDTNEWTTDIEYQDVLSNYITDDIDLVTGDFGYNDMKRQRYDHGVSIVRSTDPTTTTLAYFYVVAGRSEVNKAGNGTDPDDPYSHFGTDTLLFSRIDPDDAIPNYSLKGGWYYSRGVDVAKYNSLTTNKTDIVGVAWSAAVSRTSQITNDIKLEYRVDSLPCDNSLVFQGTESSIWQPLSRTLELSTTEHVYYSEAAGSNNAELQLTDRQKKINCFQYRAQLMTAHRNYTPILLNVGLTILSDKKPDLWVKDIIPKTSDNGNQFIGLDVTLRNFFEENKTADAIIEDNDITSFYVDMYIFAPGQQWFTKDNQPEIPFIGGHSEEVEALYHFYDTIQSGAIVANATYPPDPNNQTQWGWKDIKTNEPISMRDVMSKITDTEVYTACVVVDSYIESITEFDPWPNGYVKEAEETNNWYCVPIQLDVVPVKVCVQPIPDGKTHAKEYDEDKGGPLQGTFMISRTIDRDEDLQIFLNIRGTSAVSATQENNLPDYRFDEVDGEPIVHIDQTPGWITIPKGTLEVEFSFTPIDDELPEGDESVIIAITELKDAPYVAEGVEGTLCQPTARLLIEDNDWYVYLPIVLQE